MAEAEKKATARVTSDSRLTDDGEASEVDITKKYRLVNVIGAGSQLQATIEDLNTGQSKRISVGRDIDGLVVKSISLYDGVVFVGSDGVTQNLNVSSGK